MNAVPAFLLNDAPVAASEASTPDAALLRVCAEFIGLETWVQAIYDGPDAASDDGAEAAVCEAEERIEQLLEEMGTLRAGTLQGVHARALAVAQHNRDFGFSFDERETVAGRLLDYLMRDAHELATVRSLATPTVPT